MAGFIHLDSEGEGIPCKLDLCAFAHKWWRIPINLYFEGQTQIVGAKAHALYKESISIGKSQGTMHISPRGVSYDWSVNFQHIGELRLQGAKTYAWQRLYDWRAMRDSLITLPFNVFKGEEKIGHGELKYLSPLWHFPFGVRFCKKRFALQPRLRLAQSLSPLFSLLVPNYQKIRSQEEVVQEVEQSLERAPYVYYIGFYLCLWIARFMALLFLHCRLEKLTGSQQKELARLMSQRPLAHVFVAPLLTFLFPHIYDEEKYLAKKGANIVSPPPKAEPESFMQLSQTPKSFHRDSEIEVDAVVIGSGAAGGAVAYQLARKGHAVAIVEEGHYYKRPDFNGRQRKMMQKLYRYGGMSFPLSNAIVWLPTGKCVGGTTTINSGTCIRTPESIQQKWKRDVHPELDLAPYFQDVEKMLNVTPTPEHLQGGVRDVLKKSLQGLDYELHPLIRAESGCDGQSYCVAGCPVGAKRSTDVSYIPEALKQNAYLFTHYKVQNFIQERGRVCGIVARMEEHGEYFSLKIRAKKTFLCAGTLQTPWLLYSSGIGRHLNGLGDGLTFHPAMNLGGFFPQNVREKMFVPQSLGVFGLPQGHFVLEGYTLPVDVAPMAFNAFGEDFEDLMENIDHLTIF